MKRPSTSPAARAPLAITIAVAALLMSSCATGAANSAEPATRTSESLQSKAPSTLVKPTATALMVCSDDIRGKVQQVLRLATLPKTSSTFLDGLYSCSYALPIGTLVLSVQTSTGKDALNTYVEAARTTRKATSTLIGLGERAYGSTDGTVLVIKDNETLTVDASDLPPVFGTQGQKRTDFAYEIASDVLGCWTGND